MTSTQHAKWIRSGMRWQLARPLVALRDRLRRYGYTVYDLGDKGHMDHIPPEDHTPYSETGWPGSTPYGWVTAIDIMPPGSGLPSLQQLGAQLYADRQAGVPGVAWLKYMNWGPVSDRAAVHDQWEPGHKRSSSGDAGHIHLSSRSDVTASYEGDDYDPVARLRGQATISDGGDGMAIVGTADGGRWMVGPAGLVHIEWDEWLASGFDKAPPPVLIVPPSKLAAFQAGASVTVDVKALAAALAGQLDLDQAAVVAALASPEGQAALVRAGNTAEDS